MIQEAYVSFETAKLLKEKGFDESTSMVYMSYGDLCKLNRYDSIRNSNYNDITKNYFECTAPTQQMAMRWLREVHHIAINIGWGEIFEGQYQWWSIVLNMDSGDILYDENYNVSYEDAVETALKIVLNGLKKNN